MGRRNPVEEPCDRRLQLSGGGSLQGQGHPVEQARRKDDPRQRRDNPGPEG